MKQPHYQRKAQLLHEYELKRLQHIERLIGMATTLAGLTIIASLGAYIMWGTFFN